MFRYLALALTLLLAGCIGGDPPAEEDVAAAAVDAAETQNAVVEAEMMETSILEPLMTPVAYAGTTPEGVCQFIVGQCQWAAQGTEDFHILAVTGTPTWLSVSIAYGEQAPGMAFYAAVCPEGAEGGDGCSEYITGPSPLVLEVDLAPFAGAGFGISVGSLNGATAETGTFVFGAADFEVTGAATSMPAMPAMATASSG